MDTIGRVVYFGLILVPLPILAILIALTLVRIRGLMFALMLAPIACAGFVTVNELGPVLLNAGQLERSEFERLLYERWSALSWPLLYADAVIFVLLVVGSVLRRRRTVAVGTRRA
jgi:hypothetical protein